MEADNAEIIEFDMGLNNVLLRYVALAKAYERLDSVNFLVNDAKVLALDSLDKELRMIEKNLNELPKEVSE